MNAYTWKSIWNFFYVILIFILHSSFPHATEKNKNWKRSITMTTVLFHPIWTGASIDLSKTWETIRIWIEDEDEEEWKKIMVIRRGACECVDWIKYVGHDTIYWYYYNLRIPHILADRCVRVCICARGNCLRIHPYSCRLMSRHASTHTHTRLWVRVVVCLCGVYKTVVAIRAHD